MTNEEPQPQITYHVKAVQSTEGIVYEAVAGDEGLCLVGDTNEVAVARLNQSLWRKYPEGFELILEEPAN